MARLGGVTMGARKRRTRKEEGKEERGQGRRQGDTTSNSPKLCICTSSLKRQESSGVQSRFVGITSASFARIA